MIAAILLIVLLTSGCINSTTRHTPEEDTSVRELLQGRDCVVSIFGFGFRKPQALSGHNLRAIRLKIQMAPQALFKKFGVPNLLMILS